MPSHHGNADPLVWRVASRAADATTRLAAADALLAMGLSVAARYVLRESKHWPTIAQARAWQGIRGRAV